MTENPDLEIASKPSVVFHRNNPDVPQDTPSQLTKKGIGIIDWGLELSWNYTQVSNKREDKAKKALEAILGMNENGGYAVIHTVCV